MRSSVGCSASNCVCNFIICVAWYSESVWRGEIDALPCSPPLKHDLANLNQSNAYPTHSKESLLSQEFCMIFRIMCVCVHWNLDQMCVISFHSLESCLYPKDGSTESRTVHTHNRICISACQAHMKHIDKSEATATSREPKMGHRSTTTPLRWPCA